MKLGIIGGSGLYGLEGFEEDEAVSVQTPFGEPSDAYHAGRLGPHDVYFLPRHGRGHRLLPSEINHRANVFGFKQLGVSALVSVTAVGSLRPDFRPGDIFFPDQYFDRTRRSGEHTFFGQGLVAHIPFGEPTCRSLRTHLLQTAQRIVGATPYAGGPHVHHGGTYVNMEGPAFSTRAESEFYRAAGFDAIGMTSLPEAKLAREAEICYAAMAMVTDYDCWHASAAEVSAAAVLETVKANEQRAREVLTQAILEFEESPDCPCWHALEGAIMTDPEVIPDEVRTALAPLLGPYLGAGERTSA